MITNDMIHFISSRNLVFDLDLTCSSPLPWSIGAKSSLDLPFTLATGPSSQAFESPMFGVGN
jgi:hypothetical protein